MSDVEKIIKTLTDGLASPVIAMILIVYLIYIKLSTTYVESVFIPIKQQQLLRFSQMLMYTLFFIPMNYVMLLVKNVILMISVLMLINLLALILSEKYVKHAVNKEKLRLTLSIFAITFILICINSYTGVKIQTSQIVIIGSLVDVVILYMIMPNVMKGKYIIYFLNNKNERFYVYTRPDDNIVLCGDKEHIEDATFVTTISFEELKEKELLIEKDKNSF